MYILGLGQEIREIEKSMPRIKMNKNLSVNHGSSKILTNVYLGPSKSPRISPLNRQDNSKLKVKGFMKTNINKILVNKIIFSKNLKKSRCNFNKSSLDNYNKLYMQMAKLGQIKSR